ncbi:hypothetical protein [Mycoplasmopsis pullorum]|uniref:Uncharacterized protein n=1 Tax=Mycoplasmopsis pullorum TaxID=48003 RepID=A0A1L4FSL0_9BACT|nr:hypothetical protein [Mycoplasmopsis pullorum]APJ38601.1 hypothetical protein BLA55_02960 [Mycoplasmopsis pullorum]
MKINELKPASNKDLAKIEPGSALVTFLSAIPLVVNAIAPVVGLIKSTLSSDGEIKTKEATFKWDDAPKASQKTTEKILFFN